MLKLVGRFIYYGYYFNKTYSSPRDLIILLQNRGLLIADVDKAELVLKRIGYYRFSAYLYPLLSIPKVNHVFKPNSSFRDALAIYRFDDDLKAFLFKQLAPIEIAVRSAIANIGSKEFGDQFWMTNNVCFSNQNDFNKTLKLISDEYRRSHEEFIHHFKQTYSEPFPPAWELIEILPFGVVTRIYENISNANIQKRIASEFGLNIPVFKSWLTIIYLTRNACCHHARVWNKANTITPRELKKPNRPWVSSNVNRLRIFFNICIIKWFMDVLFPNNNMKYQLKQLLASNPNIDIVAMGFPSNWEQEPLWKN